MCIARDFLDTPLRLNQPASRPVAMSQSWRTCAGER